MKAKYLPVDVATVSDSQDVKGDRFTEGLSVRKMVDSLLETGTPFDYKDVDFTKLRDKHEQFEADLADDVEALDAASEARVADDADDMDAQDDGEGGLMTLSPAPQMNGHSEDAHQGIRVGEVDIPVRDMRYADQRQERFDDAPGHIPTFEDED